DADQDGLDKFDEGLERAKGHAQDLIGFLAKVATAAAAVAGAALYQANATAQNALAVERQAAALGLTTDAYQELAYATGKYGVEASDLADAFGQISQLAGQAAGGSEQTAAAFEQLGISIADIKASTPEQLFNQIADGLAGVTDTTTRLSLAGTLLGEDLSKKLGPLLLKGSAGVAALRREAHTLGVVLTKEDIVAAAEFSDRTAKLGGVVTSLRKEIGLALIPGLVKVADKILAWYDANEEVIKQKIDYYADKITDAFNAVADAFVKVDTAIGGADGWATLLAIVTGLAGTGGVAYVVTKIVLLVSALASAASGLVTFVGGGEAAAAIVAVIAGALAQLVIMFGLLGSAFLVLEDFYTLVQGGDSVMGRLIERYRESSTLLGALVRWWEALANLARAGGAVMTAAIEGFTAAIQPAITWAMEFGAVIETYVIGALNKAVPILDMLTAGVNALAGVVGSPGAVSAAGTAGSMAGTSAGYAATGPMQAVAAASRAAEYAPRGGGAKLNPTPSVSIGGDTISINVNSTTWREDVEQLVARISAQKARATANALAGAEV
ncbi:MAG: hypothetical protein ACEQSX_12825, partial [Baekduiaceae bacterium]